MDMCRSAAAEASLHDRACLPMSNVPTGRPGFTFLHGCTGPRLFRPGRLAPNRPRKLSRYGAIPSAPPQRFRSACRTQARPASPSAPSAGAVRVFALRHCSVTASDSERAHFLRDIPRKVPGRVTVACRRAPDPPYFSPISLKQHRKAAHRHVLFSTKTTSNTIPGPALPGSSSKDTALFSASSCFHLLSIFLPFIIVYFLKDSASSNNIRLFYVSSCPCSARSYRIFFV